jgi:hypothetical protein
MKKIQVVLFLFIFILIFKERLYATSFGNFGDVEKYVITVNALKDGSIDMLYNISLKVTSDNVEKIKVRLPQGNPSIINFNTNIISNIEFSYRQANITLKKAYNEGSKINFNFSINLKNVYKYNEKKGIVVYRIMIGEIKNFTNKDITVNWSKNGVYFQGRGKEEGNYYVWQQQYSLLRSFQVMIQYKEDKFNFTTGGKKFNIEEYFYEYWMVSVGIFVIILEVRKNIINKRAAKFPFRTKNVI